MYDFTENPGRGRGHEHGAGGPDDGAQRPRHPRRHGGFGPPMAGPFGGRGRGRGPGFRRGGPFGGGFGPEGFEGFGGPGGGPGGPGGPGGRRGGPRGHGRGGPGGRRNRGDVRNAVLALLAEQPMHGYQIIQEIGERSGGAWRPSPGSVYPTVSQLADEGLVYTEKADGRSVVHLTDEGQRHVAEHREALDAVWNTAAAEDGFAALRTAGRGLVGAAWQVAQVGTPEQVAEAVRLLDETRRRLYLLLAGESAVTDAPTDQVDDADDDSAEDAG